LPERVAGALLILLTAHNTALAEPCRGVDPELRNWRARGSAVQSQCGDAKDRAHLAIAKIERRLFTRRGRLAVDPAEAAGCRVMREVPK
jgi:hypothetical protein